PAAEPLLELPAELGHDGTDLVRRLVFDLVDDARAEEDDSKAGAGEIDSPRERRLLAVRIRSQAPRVEDSGEGRRPQDRSACETQAAPPRPNVRSDAARERE